MTSKITKYDNLALGVGDEKDNFLYLGSSRSDKYISLLRAYKWYTAKKVNGFPVPSRDVKLQVLRRASIVPKGNSKF